jgi:hypothetical protein
MVFVKTKWGGYNEPPYTEAEIREFKERISGGVVAFKRLPRDCPPDRDRPEDHKGS